MFGKVLKIRLLYLIQNILIHILMLDGTKFCLILYTCFIVTISSFRLVKICPLFSYLFLEERER